MDSENVRNIVPLFRSNVNEVNTGGTKSSENTEACKASVSGIATMALVLKS